MFICSRDADCGRLSSISVGVFFNFDISPMLVIQKEERKSFTSFLTGVCAIVGGIFTVASIIDGAIWRAERTLKRKMELGKAL